MPNQATASDLLFCDIFVPLKVFLLKNCDDIIAHNLYFAPLPLIKNPGYAYVSVQPVKPAAIQWKDIRLTISFKKITG